MYTCVSHVNSTRQVHARTIPSSHKYILTPYMYILHILCDILNIIPYTRSDTLCMISSSHIYILAPYMYTTSACNSTNSMCALIISFIHSDSLYIHLIYTFWHPIYLISYIHSDTLHIYVSPTAAAHDKRMQFQKFYVCSHNLAYSFWYPIYTSHTYSLTPYVSSHIYILTPYIYMYLPRQQHTKVHTTLEILGVLS